MLVPNTMRGFGRDALALLEAVDTAFAFNQCDTGSIVCWFSTLLYEDFFPWVLRFSPLNNNKNNNKEPNNNNISFDLNCSLPKGRQEHK